MFSGIVRDVGTVVGAMPEGNGRRLSVRSALPRVGTDAVALGDSISVNGACLTVDALAPDGFEVVLGRETIDRTTLAGLSVGASVNLERSLRLSDRLDGHLVAGHVDGVGSVRSATRDAESVVIWMDRPAEPLALVGAEG